MEFAGIKPSEGPPRIVAATAADLAALSRLRPDARFNVRITFDRSNPHNRWYRKLVSVVADGLGMHPQALHAELKFKAGFVRRILTSEAFGVAVELDSTAFDTMDEIKFTEFRSLAVEILFRDFLPGVERRYVYAKVHEMLGDPCPW